jgi:hypothetical protein
MYRINGRTVIGNSTWRNTSGGTAGAGANPLTTTYPAGLVPATVSGIIGEGHVYESGGTICPVFLTYDSASNFTMLNESTEVSIKGDDQSSAARRVDFILAYEI